MVRKRSRFLTALQGSGYLYLLLLPWVVYYIVFDIVPLFGSVIAFKDYSAFLGVLKSPWTAQYGFKYFISFFKNPGMLKLFRNTFLISIETLLWMKVLSILMALFINELRSKRVKMFVQTATYIPHFISTTVICGIAVIMLSPVNGLINTVLVDVLHIADQPIYFMGQSGYFRSIYIGTGLWQNLGFATIVYLATMSSIDPLLYEALEVDGGTRFDKIRYITLPLLMPTIVMLLILDMGNILDVGAEKILLLYNPLTYETADVFSTYVYRVGLRQGQFSQGAALDVLNGSFSVALVAISNFLSKKIFKSSLW